MKGSRRLAALAFVGLMVTLAFASRAPSAAAVLSPNPPSQAYLTPNQTAVVDDAAPAANFGNPNFLKAASLSGPHKIRWLMQFDVSAIPSNAQVVSAVLYLFTETTTTPAGSTDVYVSGVSPAFLDVVRTTGAWNQNTVTWNNQPTFHAVDFATFPFTGTSFGVQENVALAEIVQEWVSGAVTNNGLDGMMSDESGGTYHASLNLTGMSSPVHQPERPSLVVQYVLPTAIIYPAFYCASGPCEGQVMSGSGLPAYLFAVWYSENNGSLRRAVRPDILFTNISTYYRVQVRDFWNNILYNQAHMVNLAQSAWNVSINFALLNVYAMDEQFTNLTVQPAGGTPMIIWIPPRGWIILPLHVGTTYYLNFTRYTDAMAVLSTIRLVRTMPSYGLAYKVNGTTIVELMQQVNNNWQATNVTQGLAGATGNLVGGLYQFNLFKPIGPWIPLLGYLSVWMLLFFIEIAAAVAWVFAYGSRVRKTGLHIANAERAVKGLPVRANVILAAIVILGLFVFTSWVFNASGAQVLIPLPFGP